MSEPIYDRVMNDLTSLFTRLRYDRTDTTPPEARMSWLDTIRTEISGAVTWGEDELRARLPTAARAADIAEAVAASAPVQAILSAVLSPEDEQIIVGLVQRLDKGVHDAEQHVEAAALADSEPVAAGPVVGGQA